MARSTLGGAANASASAGTAGAVGSDCRQGGTTALIKEGAQLQGCNLNGVALLDPDLDVANLTDASLISSTPGSGHFVGAILTRANLSAAGLAGADFTNARLDDSNLTNVDFTLATFTGATLSGAMLTGANCSGATATNGTVFPFPGFAQC